MSSTLSFSRQCQRAFAGLALVSGLLLALPVHAEVKLPAIFGSHMVLQENAPIPVWGTADPGETVTVALGRQLKKTTADSSGRWKVSLQPFASAQPETLTVTGKNAVTFEDVLIGDVWLCSGQSNMRYVMRGTNTAKTEIPKANEPQIRLFRVLESPAVEPQADLQGKWEVCSPTSVMDFSAVAYFFGRELQHSLNKPIGLIGSYVGGTPAQAWTSLAGLQQAPVFQGFVNEIQRAKKSAAAAPAPEAAPQAPAKPGFSARTATVLYNGMIAPLVPYAIKGAIWYQGEANAGRGDEYAPLFVRMITDWRTQWGQGDFPFLFVQLPNYMAAQTEPSEGGWALVRDSQRKTLSLPNTGMAVTIDLGEANNLHPKNKLDVGQRLALVARHVAYKQDLVFSGPLYDSMKVEGNKIRLSFTNLGSGLKIGAAPGKDAQVATELAGFAIAGADQKWNWAKAVIEGKSVVVSSDQVAAPVAVRFGWANNPPCNLYNNEGLPASPFRTDDWTDPAPARGNKAAPATPPPSE